MAALRVNILANYAGQIWMAVIGIAFLPLYIRILGVEAFGLVGLMLSFQAILQLFDFGIGGATNRELSRRAHDPAFADRARDLVRTSETVVWLLALIAALLFWAFSGWMAEHWLNLRGIRPAEASRALAIMSFAIALLWPSTFYANCLSGLERQPELNALNAIFVTLRYAGVLPVLVWGSPTVEAFLWWHALIGVAQSFATALAVWHALPYGHRPARWSFVELQGSKHFAGGLFAVGVLALGVSQLDRLILTSLRPLEELGYYTLALSVAGGLSRVVQPMFNALYPRFSRLVAQRDEAALHTLYHLSSQYLAVVIASVSAVLIVFAQEVLFFWTGDSVLADKVALPLSLLVAGSACNGLMNIPYALQLAHGWTRLAVVFNAIALILGLPLCIWAVQLYGMSGAALPWLLVNLLSVIVGIPLIHRRLLPGEVARWYLRDNLPPLLAGFGVALTLRALVPELQRDLTGFAWLGLASGCTLATCALASPEARSALLRIARRAF